MRDWQPIDATEDTLLREIERGDDASRDVYADYLEERGDSHRAELLRVQEALRVTEAIDPAFDDLLRRMRELGRKVDPQWRARIERQIEIPFSIEFPKHIYGRPQAPPATSQPLPNPSSPVSWRSSSEDRVEPIVVRAIRPRPARPPTAEWVAPDVPAAVNDGERDWVFVTSLAAGALLVLVMLLHWLGVVG